ncbi:MAG: tRNA uridine-5-carboxymethylaminomethyl(34) synthesis enzyme MnmG, partial [Gammaproteobacteria bacterium]|nr:tRNA uridine-5-carboxymethylaminomethyl(34) synthesis enzyme MnmG [Gammaproteobacteria bacterium]
IAYQLGLVDEHRWQIYANKQQKIDKEQARLKQTWLRPDRVPVELIKQAIGQELVNEANLADLLKRPGVEYEKLMHLPDMGPGEHQEQVIEQIEINAKYAGYIQRQQDEILRLKRNEETAMPEDLDYAQVSGLSNEVRQKLTQQKPTTLGQAGRIPGVTPAAISLLLVHLKKRSLAHGLKSA